MNHNMAQKYRISITDTTMQELEKLRYAFEGRMAHGEHQNCSDDVLVAALLGWHLRQVGEHDDWFAKALAYEFSMRERLFRDPESKWIDEAEKAKRSHFRGSPSTEGNVLTLDGIDIHTVQRIETRAHAVKMMVRKLSENYGERAPQRLVTYSDQAIIDLGVWWNVTLPYGDHIPENDNYPFWVKDEIMARGEARRDYEAGLGEPTEDGTSIASDPSVGMPALTPGQRTAFFRSRRIVNTGNFWTDERIRAAMELGM